MRRIVHQGGQSSGKTVNILLALAVYANENPGSVITVTSMSFPHLKAGALRDFERFVYPYFTSAIKSYHKTNHLFTFHSGSIIEFKTYETEYDARGAKRDILFINEANTFDYMTYFQLDSRSAITIIDYNPTISFWAHELVIGTKGTAFRISDHRHNPFLTAEKHEEIENIKDPELWKVYARGKTGNVVGLIYPDWTMVDEMPTVNQSEIFVFGIDYGYTNDPTAIAKIARIGESIYTEEVCYKTGSMPPKSIKMMLEAHEYIKQYPIYSEHDPDMIKQMAMLGLFVIPARKAAGSLNAGIEKIKEFKMYYTANSRNIKKELGMYIWMKDDKGNSTNTPVDANNHILDAIRYGVYSHFYRAKNAA